MTSINAKIKPIFILFDFQTHEMTHEMITRFVSDDLNKYKILYYEH